jgi:hypothetical protein
LSNNNIYIASWSYSIYIYYTNDEITFNKIHTISSSIRLAAITIYNGNIYAGTNNGRILVYDKINFSLTQNIATLCSEVIRSIKFYYNANMIHSCFNPPKAIIIGTNGVSSLLLLNDSFTRASETYIDSKNRLWIGGDTGLIVYD